LFETSTVRNDRHFVQTLTPTLGETRSPRIQMSRRRLVAQHAQHCSIGLQTFGDDITRYRRCRPTLHRADGHTSFDHELEATYTSPDSFRGALFPETCRRYPRIQIGPAPEPRYLCYPKPDRMWHAIPRNSRGLKLAAVTAARHRFLFQHATGWRPTLLEDLLKLDRYRLRKAMDICGSSSRQ